MVSGGGRILTNVWLNALTALIRRKFKNVLPDIRLYSAMANTARGRGFDCRLSYMIKPSSLC